MYESQAAIKAHCEPALTEPLRTEERIAKLMPGLGWLNCVTSVHLLFEIFFGKYEGLLKKARKNKCLKAIEPHQTRREIIRFLSDDRHTDQTVGDQVINIRALYRECLEDIERRCKELDLRPNRALEGFSETIAVLHSGIHLARKL